MWCGNPDKWAGSGPMDAYIADASQYVYWSTPPRQCRHAEIQVGKRAYIWRTTSKSGPRGIIAIGVVAEAPRQYSSGSARLFARPERIDVGEEAASSEWKTGISIDDFRLRIQTGMLTADELEKLALARTFSKILEAQSFGSTRNSTVKSKLCGRAKGLVRNAEW
jgi:hypothetical protein